MTKKPRKLRLAELCKQVGIQQPVRLGFFRSLPASVQEELKELVAAYRAGTCGPVNHYGLAKWIIANEPTITVVPDTLAKWIKDEICRQEASSQGASRSEGARETSCRGRTPKKRPRR